MHGLLGSLATGCCVHGPLALQSPVRARERERAQKSERKSYTPYHTHPRCPFCTDTLCSWFRVDTKLCIACLLRTVASFMRKTLSPCAVHRALRANPPRAAAVADLQSFILITTCKLEP